MVARGSDGGGDSGGSDQSAKLHQISSQDPNHFLGTNLSGSFQQRNASLAYQATRILEKLFPLEERKVEQALQSVRFPGRWQKISTQPTVILDACHNGQGAEVSTELWDTLPEGFHLWFSACGEERAGCFGSPKSANSEYYFVELNQPGYFIGRFSAFPRNYHSAHYAQEKDIPNHILDRTIFDFTGDGIDLSGIRSSRAIYPKQKP